MNNSKAFLCSTVQRSFIPLFLIYKNVWACPEVIKTHGDKPKKSYSLSLATVGEEKSDFTLGGLGNARKGCIIPISLLYFEHKD